MKQLVLVDGNSIANRAFYGIMGNKMLMTSDGTYTNAVYGFLSILFKIIDDIKPEYIAVAFDLKAPTKRHKMYEGYKATRKGMPEELAEQMPLIKEILRAMNIDIVEKEVQIASNTGIFRYIKMIISNNVNVKYILHNMAAVCLILGASLLSFKPENSAKNICLPAIENWGKTTVNKTNIPIPPIHWLNERQKNITLGYREKSDNIVAPVVVIPETLSNNASIGFNPKYKNGIVPNKHIKTQDNITIQKASDLLILFISSLLLSLFLIKKLIPNDIIEVPIKGIIDE